MATFRKSKKIGGVRLTVSKRGLSASTGVKGARISANTKGEVHRTISAPGTGIYDVVPAHHRSDDGDPDAEDVRGNSAAQAYDGCCCHADHETTNDNIRQPTRRRSSQQVTRHATDCRD